MDKSDLLPLTALVTALFVLFGTTLLLDWPWIMEQPARQVIVYVLLCAEAWFFGRLLWKLSNPKKQ